MDEDFKKIVDKVGVITSIVETKKSNIIGSRQGIVVPSESAVIGRGAVYHIEDVRRVFSQKIKRNCGIPDFRVINM